MTSLVFVAVHVAALDEVCIHTCLLQNERLKKDLVEAGNAASAAVASESFLLEQVGTTANRHVRIFDEVDTCAYHRTSV